MAKKYTSEEFWKLYEKLPQELKDALFAEETGNNIYDICKKNGVEENLEAIVDLIGQVLVGVLVPEDFQETIEKELRLEKKAAKKITQEINRFIFYPVKPALEQLYKIEIAKPAGMEGPKPRIAAEDEEEKPVAPSKEDIYREIIE